MAERVGVDNLLEERPGSSGTSHAYPRGDRPSSYREYLYNPDSMPKRLRSKLEKQLSAADTNNTHAALGSDMLTPMLQEEAEYSEFESISASGAYHNRRFN